jgi:hypothetical protein
MPEPDMCILSQDIVPETRSHSIETLQSQLMPAVVLVLPCFGTRLRQTTKDLRDISQRSGNKLPTIVQKVYLTPGKNNTGFDE